MKSETIIKDHVIQIIYGDEFAILERKPNHDGLQGITFSIPILPRHADLLDKSGIVEVVKYSASGTLVFRRKSFYETHLIIELITDILEKYEAQRNS